MNRGKLPEEELSVMPDVTMPIWMGLLMFWGTQLRVGESAQKLVVNVAGLSGYLTTYL